MEVSSVTQSYLTTLYAQAKNKLASTEIVQSSQNENGDSVSISDTSQQIAKMPPPPHEMDFENLPDDELKEYLQQMYEITGIVPGASGSVADLTDEDLANVRATLIEMSQSGPISEVMSSENASQLSADDFKTLLTMFMISMQSSLSETDDSSTDSSLLSGYDMDLIMQLLLEKLSGDTEQSSSGTQTGQQAAAAAAYAQSATTQLY